MSSLKLSHEGYTGRYSIGVYKQLILTAQKAKTSPSQSNFNVYAAGMTKSGKFVGGGNIEYALTDAIHAEESLVALAHQISPGDPLAIVGFMGNNEIKPCGNCRDLLRAYSTEDLEIVNAANSTLTDATIYPFKSTFLMDNFSDSITNQRDIKLIDRAYSALDNSYDRFLPDNKKNKLYGVSINSIIGIFSGGFEGCIAFDPTLPIRTASNALMYSGTNVERFKLNNVTIVSFEKPDVLYKDRQQLNELVHRLSSYGCVNPLPIKLVKVKPTPAGRYQIEQAWQTDSKLWFPHAFNPPSLKTQESDRKTYRRLN